ncbi:hypothetical protein [Pseudanabaena sp. SR411]|uniref:hypothetical protein n=1 Tax=Pseudanabaena sp. SR411 TaxID=1980935 RepID=UPI0015952D03|nr:hypothetical protein [Pseudanabaena sp. SR411]
MFLIASSNLILTLGIKLIAYSLKSTNDRTLITHKTRSPNLKIKQRSHPQHPQA